MIRENFEEVPQKLQFATFLDSDNIEEIQDFLNESVKSNFLLACYNDDMDCYETICKVFIGFYWKIVDFLGFLMIFRLVRVLVKKNWT